MTYRVENTEQKVIDYVNKECYDRLGYDVIDCERTIMERDITWVIEALERYDAHNDYTTHYCFVYLDWELVMIADLKRFIEKL